MAGKQAGRYYALALIVSAFLGSKVMAINIGVQLSIYRILLILSPIIIVLCPYNRSSLNETKTYTQLLKQWFIYCILLLPLIHDYAAWGHNLFFLISALLTSYMAGRYLHEKQDVEIVLTGFVVIMLFDALIGVQEMITGIYQFIPENNMDYYDTRSAIESTLGVRVPISVAGNPNDFGMMMVFAFIATVTLFSITEHRILKLIYIILSLFFIYMVVACQSRSQFMSLLIAIALLLFNVYRRQSRKAKMIIWTLIIMLGSYVVGLIVANQDLFLALLEIDVSGNESDAVRWDLIQNGLTIFVDSFFLGVGIGNIEYHMAQPGLLNTNGVINIHNWWLEILVSSGIYIFVLYCSFYVRTLKGFLHKSRLYIKRDSKRYSLAICGLTSMIVFILSSMGSSSIFATEWFWAYFVMLFLFNNIFKNIKVYD